MNGCVIHTYPTSSVTYFPKLAVGRSARVEGAALPSHLSESKPWEKRVRSFGDEIHF
jgi:hypothetical protein